MMLRNLESLGVFLHNRYYFFNSKYGKYSAEHIWMNPFKYIAGHIWVNPFKYIAEHIWMNPFSRWAVISLKKTQIQFPFVVFCNMQERVDTPVSH